MLVMLVRITENNKIFFSALKEPSTYWKKQTFNTETNTRINMYRTQYIDKVYKTIIFANIKG